MTGKNRVGRRRINWMDILVRGVEEWIVQGQSRLSAYVLPEATALSVSQSCTVNVDMIFFKLFKMSKHYFVYQNELMFRKLVFTPEMPVIRYLPEFR